MKQGLAEIEKMLFGTVQGSNPETRSGASQETGGDRTDVHDSQNRVQPSAKLGEGHSHRRPNRKSADPSKPFKERSWKTEKENCRRKRRYDDKKAALTARNGILGSHRRNRPENLRAYPCPFCRGWHLTRRDAS